MEDALAEHLNALARDDCYRVDAVLKQSPCEMTERVHFQGANGAELGPFVRKTIDRESGIGAAYERICAAQRAGRRFVYLPRVIDCHEAGDRLVVIMEHVGGETLQEVVYRCDPSLELAADVFPRLCDAVSELHEGFDAPLIHRDLKPSNVMLSQDSLTIIDFGIARAYKEESEEDTRRFGTRAYAPPEQFGFGQTDVRSDVYALGLLLYFCLTERTPDAQARAAGYAAPEIPEPVRAVIARAAAFDPVDRYGSAAELKRAFLDAVGAAGARAAGAAAPAAAVQAAPVVPVAQAPGAAFATVPDADRCTPGTAAPFAATVPRQLGAGGVRAPRQRFRTLRELLARVPFGVGVAWDAVVGLVFALFLWAASSLSFNPDPGDSTAQMPLAFRALTYYGMVVLMFGPLFFLVLDRRPLRRLFPRLGPLRPRTLVACLAAFVAGVAAVALASVLGTPAH